MTTNFVNIIVVALCAAPGLMWLISGQFFLGIKIHLHGSQMSQFSQTLTFLFNLEILSETDLGVPLVVRRAGLLRVREADLRLPGSNARIHSVEAPHQPVGL